MGNSPARPLIIGGVAGFLIGLIIGLFYAWQIDPAVYGGGARFNDLNPLYLNAFGETVAEAYITTRDANAASQRLGDLTVPEKVALLAQAEQSFSQTDATKAALVGQLATDLRNLENWSDDDVAAGLSTANASNSFAAALGQAPISDGQQPSTGTDGAATPPDEAGGGSFLGTLIRVVGILFLLLVAIAVIILVLLRMRPAQRRSSTPPPPTVPEIVNDEGDTLQPLRQWVGTYTFGQDNYDESFTVETPESDFLGECGMGILDGFASGSPKKVAAFDVWLFDKTDIRTVSMPIMSQFAYEDDILRGKLNPEAIPVLASEGTTFDIETTALMVKARIEEVEYGDEIPPNSYFTRLKVSLTAYLKPGIDVKADMPLPEGYDTPNV